MSRIKTRSGAVTRSGLQQEGHFRPLSRPSHCQGDCETRATAERGQAEDTFSDEMGGTEQREIGALQSHPEQRRRESQSRLLGVPRMKQNSRPLCWDRAELQLLGGDAAAPSREGMQPSLHKSGFSAVLATCCAKSTAWCSELHYCPPAAGSGAGLLPTDCLEGTKIAAQGWEQGSISTSSGEVSPGKGLISHVPWKRANPTCPIWNPFSPPPWH